MLPKPSTCTPCSLAKRGFAYTNPAGPVTSPVLLLGESSGRAEGIQGTPFVGPAGAMLSRIIQVSGFDRDFFRVDNIIRCQPPGDWLDGAPWEQDAIATCHQYLSHTLAEGHPVVVTMGGLATRKILDLPREKFRIQDFHGTVSRDPTDRFWVVPTFHPSYLQRGANNLIGTVAKHDLRKAVSVAKNGFTRPKVILVCDPTIAWFSLWADRYLAACGRSEPIDLAVDIETYDTDAGQDEGELQALSWDILRVNFACNGEEGITVQFKGAYIAIIRRLLAAPYTKLWWNKKYDIPRLVQAECPVNGINYDLMWAWHKLQSDLPKGLGFVAPFYSDLGPWKHLSDADPKLYAAYDGVQTWICGDGTFKDLVRQGLWDSFQRHSHEYHQVILDPAEEIGCPIDRKALEQFHDELVLKRDAIDRGIQDLVPTAIKPVHPKGGWKKWEKCSDQYGVFGVREPCLVQTCVTCGAVEVSKTHRCKGEDGKIDKSLTPDIQLKDLPVPRYYIRLPFNPGSWQQILRYIHSRGHIPGRQKKTGKPTTDKDTLKRLYEKHGDPLYARVLKFRRVAKVIGTYIEGTLNRLDENDRVHPTFSPNTSTDRTASKDPNIQNIIDDKDGENIAAGFRKCIVAGNVGAVVKVGGVEFIVKEPSLFVEGDYSGIEAVQVGWYSGDPNYIRLAHLGMHGYLASQLTDNPADLSWSDDDLAGYFAEIKAEQFELYDTAKHCVHGENFGLTVKGMMMTYRDWFPTLKDAQRVHDMYMGIAPMLPKWWAVLRQTAHTQGYLGGSDHPFGYVHWFWSILKYRPLNQVQYKARKARGYPTDVIYGKPMAVDFGEDSKRAIAFYPQSTANGILREASFRLFDPEEESPNYIGDLYHGHTPLRAPIHDSLFLEVPESKVDQVVRALAEEMTRPIEQQPCPPEWNMGSHLAIGVEIKVGRDWSKKSMKQVYKSRPGVAGDLRAEDPDVEEDEQSGAPRPVPPRPPLNAHPETDSRVPF